MTREYCINHLIDNECYPDDPFNVDGVGQLWRHGINGQICYVPYEDELSLTTYCHIFYELKVDPPLEYGYDSDYYVYVGFREVRLKKDLASSTDNNFEPPSQN